MEQVSTLIKKIENRINAFDEFRFEPANIGFSNNLFKEKYKFYSSYIEELESTTETLKLALDNDNNLAVIAFLSDKLVMQFISLQNAITNDSYTKNKPNPKSAYVNKHTLEHLTDHEKLSEYYKYIRIFNDKINQYYNQIKSHSDPNNKNHLITKIKNLEARKNNCKNEIDKLEEKISY